MTYNGPMLLGFTFLFACFGHRETEFPSGLEPFTDNVAVFPDAVSGELPEDVDIQLGNGDAWDWANARGYVRAPLSDVWAAVKNPDVGVDRRAVTDWTVTFDVEPEYDVSYDVHERVVDIVTVEYDLTWREGLVPSGRDDLVVARWQKTDGTSLISVLEGSVVLTPVEDGVTGVEIVEHLGTPQDDRDRLEAFFLDLFASIAAASHGDPLPTYEG